MTGSAVLRAVVGVAALPVLVPLAIFRELDEPATLEPDTFAGSGPYDVDEPDHPERHQLDLSPPV